MIDRDQITHKELPPEIFGLKGWIELIDEEQLKETFSTALNLSGLTTLNYTSHRFPVNGFTAFWLLAESHLALHTFTESGWCYIELSSCNLEKTEQFKELLNSSPFNLKWDQDRLVTSTPLG